MANYQILIGDVYSVECDAVAVPVPKSLKFEGELGGQALEQAGPELLNEVEGKFIEMTKSILVDSHNHKNSKYFILCANPKKLDDEDYERLTDTVINATQLCIDKGLKSVVFPLLSTGSYKLVKKDAIDAILFGLETFEDVDIDITVVMKDYSTYYNARDYIDSDIWGYRVRKSSEEYDKYSCYRRNESFYWHSKYSYQEFDETKYLSFLDKYREHLGMSANEMCKDIIIPREFSEYRNGREDLYSEENIKVYPTPLKAVLLAYKVQMNPGELELYFKAIPNFKDCKDEYIKFVELYIFAVENQMSFIDAKSFFTNSLA